MSRTADPLKRLSAANPVSSLPTVDWERIQQHVTYGAGEPRARRPRLLVLAGTSCVGLLVLGAITIVLLSSASKPGRTSSSMVVCDRGHAGCRGTQKVGVLFHGGVLPPLWTPNPNVKPATVQSCAVIGPGCVQGCVLQVSGPLHTSAESDRGESEDLRTKDLHDHPAGARQRCRTKMTQQPCFEDVASARTRSATGKAVREDLVTERTAGHAAGPSTPFCRPLFRDLQPTHSHYRAQQRR